MHRGVDISNLNGNVDMSLIKNAGSEFVICRATEGTSGSGSQDEKYHQNMSNAKVAGLKTGAYHFSHFADIAKEESELQNFLNFIQDTTPDMIVLDAENSCQGDITGLCLDFLDNIAQIAQPLIYCNPSWLRTHLNASIMKYPLWIANYGVSSPDIGFYDGYGIWQYSDKGQISGVSGYVDLNYMTDTLWNLISGGYTPPADKLKEQIRALQYDLNSEYNAGLVVGGVAGPATMAALKGIQNIIVKGHKSYVVLWIQQKLESYGYLQPGSYKEKVYDEPTFQAVTNLQKNWGRPTDGVLRIETWSIFLNNE
ncbi:GH25 family lysozyme [Clostridium luticellarii]|uniref:Autolytic lysozyme n=1 Tax=Clostridium luticellarii TaxID=1691940 RepID=A0A2T0BLS0_9CLOT|nr:GH25 family lysozyme [Clostridium luticellarii]PRR84732.1 Autolytic lysozyme [Clostridium luticellarii]